MRVSTEAHPMYGFREKRQRRLDLNLAKETSPPISNGRPAGWSWLPGMIINLTTIAVVLMMDTVWAQQTGETLSLPPLTVDEEPEALTRGPLHEAFAEVYADPEPGLIVKKVPPEPLDEIPPSHRPEGDDVAWISGYWAWEEDGQDFIWISGVWRKVPPGRSWVPGYWQGIEEGQQWISGFWAKSGQGNLEYLPTPPPSAESGPSSLAPSDDHLYVPGCWRYVDDLYRWRPGFWTLQHDNWAWIPHRYVWTQHGCIFRSGYWDYLPIRRGVLFAPVHFRVPWSGQRNYRYTPSCVIDVGPSLLVHLFVRPGYCHYYFGDYYAARYRQSRIYPWVTCWQQYRHYDPLFAYYYYHGGRRNSVVNRVHGWHSHFARHAELRPTHTFADQHRRRDQGNVRQVASLGRSFQSELQRPRKGHSLIRVDQRNREKIRSQVEPLREIGRLRAAVESRVADGDLPRTTASDGSRSKLRPRDLAGQNGRAKQRERVGRETPGTVELRKQLSAAIGNFNRERTVPGRRTLDGRNRPSGLDQLPNRLREQQRATAGERFSPSSNTASIRQEHRPDRTPNAADSNRARNHVERQTRRSFDSTRRAPASASPRPILEGSANSLRVRSAPRRTPKPSSEILRGRARTETRRPSGFNVTPRASARPAPSFRSSPRPDNSFKRQRAANPSRGGARLGGSPSRSFGERRGSSSSRGLGGNRGASSARSFGGAGSGRARARSRDFKPERHK